MIGVRDLRFWTALGMIGVAALAMKPALSLVSFGFVETFEATPARLAAYDDVPGAGSLARELALRQAPASEAAARLAEGLAARRPLASGDWLGLARLDLAARADLKGGLAAAALSNVTGPNEGGLMAGRAALLVPLWGLLPADLRRTAAADLVSGWGMMSAAERQGVVRAAQNFAPAAQANLKAALLLAGEGGRAVLAALALPEAAPALPAEDGASPVSAGGAAVVDPALSQTAGSDAALKSSAVPDAASGALAGSKAILAPGLRPALSGGATGGAGGGQDRAAE